MSFATHMTVHTAQGPVNRRIDYFESSGEALATHGGLRPIPVTNNNEEIKWAVNGDCYIVKTQEKPVFLTALNYTQENNQFITRVAKFSDDSEIMSWVDVMPTQEQIREELDILCKRPFSRGMSMPPGGFYDDEMMHEEFVKSLGSPIFEESEVNARLDASLAHLKENIQPATKIAVKIVSPDWLCREVDVAEAFPDGFSAVHKTVNNDHINPSQQSPNLERADKDEETGTGDTDQEK